MAPIAQEQDALYPTSAHQHIAEGDGNTRLACTRRLDEERLAKMCRKAFADSLYCLELVHPVRDGEIRRDRGERLFVAALVCKIFETVSGIEAMDFSVRVNVATRPAVSFTGAIGFNLHVRAVYTNHLDSD